MGPVYIDAVPVRTLSRAMKLRKAYAKTTVRKSIKVSVLFLLFTLASRKIYSQGQDGSWADVVLKGMTLEEKVGQLLQARFTADYPSPSSPELLAIIDEIKRYHLGSMTLGARMAGPNLVKSSPERVAEVINLLQENTKVPLLIGVDIERGVASRVAGAPEFPFPMAFGAIGDPILVERFGRVTAAEARAIGINWAYAPVADVSNNPRNPIINTRSFGDKPEQVAKLVAAYIRGAHSNSSGTESYLLLAAKHFPGEGDTTTDPHARSTTISGNRDHLDRVELAPFRAAFQANVDSVMLAQAFVPAIEPDTNKIAPTSERLVEGLLRKEFKFRGLVLTDALEMRGATEIYSGETHASGRLAVEAFKAGDDVLMLPSDLDAAYSALLQAVKKGEISQQRLDESVRRILLAKEAVGLARAKSVDLSTVHAVFADPDAHKFAQEVSDASVTLVRNSGRLLPLKQLSPVQKALKSDDGPKAIARVKKLVFITFTDSLGSKLGRRFDQEVKRRRPDVKVLHFYHDLRGSDANQEIISLVRDADVVVVGAFVTHLGLQQIPGRDKLHDAVGFAGGGAALFAKLLDIARTKTVVIALGSPYLIEEFPTIENYICTYSLASTAEVSAVKAVFGELTNTAKLPIDLPGVAKRGHSLTWFTSDSGEARSVASQN